MTNVKGIATVIGIAAFGAVSATVLASPASANGAWSAIAISPSTQVFGMAIGYTPEGGPDSAAAKRALQECANHPVHPSDCEWVASAKCVALAVGPDRYRVGMGSTRDEAKNDAQFPGSTYKASGCSKSTTPPQGSSGQ